MKWTISYSKNGFETVFVHTKLGQSLVEQKISCQEDVLLQILKVKASIS